MGDSGIQGSGVWSSVIHGTHRIRLRRFWIPQRREKVCTGHFHYGKFPENFKTKWRHFWPRFEEFRTCRHVFRPCRPVFRPLLHEFCIDFLETYIFRFSWKLPTSLPNGTTIRTGLREPGSSKASNPGWQETTLTFSSAVFEARRRRFEARHV